MVEDSPLSNAGDTPPDTQTEWLETIRFVLSAIRGTAVIPVVADFSWTTIWAENGRRQGGRGTSSGTERVATLEPFLSPVWVADIWYSRARSGLFPEGQRQHAVAFVDACKPVPRHVVVQNETFLVRALQFPRALTGADVAMPKSGPTQAASVMTQALLSRPEYHDLRLGVRGLAYVGAATVTYTDGPHVRRATTALNQQILIDDYAHSQIQTTQRLLRRYG